MSSGGGNFDLPDDLFGGRKDDESPEKDRAEKIKKGRLSPGGILRSLGVDEEFFEGFGRFLGVTVSLVLHFILLLIFSGMIIYRYPDEGKYVVLEIRNLEIKTIEDIPEPEVPELSDRENDGRDVEESAIEIEVENSALNFDEAISDCVSYKEVEIPELNLDALSIEASNSNLNLPTALCLRSKKFREKALKKYGGSEKTEEAVEKALNWLKSAQNKDGSWGKIDDGNSVVLSSLATLSFLAHGETPQSQKYGWTVHRALKKLIEFSDDEYIENNAMGFGHAVLAYALSEAALITGLPEILEVAEQRVRAIVHGQNKYGSFYFCYDKSPMEAEKDLESGKLNKEIIPGEPGCDLSFAGWNYQALCAAYLAGADVEGLEKAIEKANVALKYIHQAKRGGFSYGYNRQKNDADPSMTPVGLLCTELLGKRRNPDTRRALTWLRKYQKGRMMKCKWQDRELKYPLYTWYYQTQGLFHACEGTGRMWKKWNRELTDMLLKKQRGNGCWVSPLFKIGAEKESGENMDVFKSYRDLAIYSTSLCSLMLQVYYRYLPTFDLKKLAMKKGELFKRDKKLRLKMPGISKKYRKKMKAVFKMPPVKIGRLNGRPSGTECELVKDEFSVHSGEGQTVHVKEAKDFPQVLKPDQRIAMFLDEKIPENFLGNMLLTLSVASKLGLELKKEKDKIVSEERYNPALSILFNGKTIWAHRLKSELSYIETVIPAGALQAGGNILQIRNVGNTPVAFDHFILGNYKIDKPVYLALEDIENMPPESRVEFTKGLINFRFPEKSEKDRDLDKFIKESNETKVTFGELPVQDSLERRQCRISFFYERFKRETSKIPTDDELQEKLKELRNKIIKQIKMGLEPVVRISGSIDKELLECIVKACSNYVYFWIVSDDSSAAALAAQELIKAYIPPAEIIIENKTPLSQKHVCTLSSYKHDQQPLPNILKGISGKKDLEELKLPQEIWAFWPCRDTINRGLEFQKKYIKNVPLEMTQWLWSGGTSIALSEIVSGGKFFDSVNRNEKPAFYGLERMSMLFNGCHKLPCNLTPVAKDEILNEVYWAAVLNDKGVATIQIASKWALGKSVNVVCPLPWEGKTKMTVIKGFLPENYPVNGISKLRTEESDIEIKTFNRQALFTHTLPLDDCVTIRLVQDGKKFKSAKPKDLLAWKEPEREKFTEGIIEVSKERPSSGLIRTPLRWSNGSASVEGKNYRYSEIEATMGKIDGVKNVVPWDKKSTLIEIDYSGESAQNGPEGARVFFGPGPSNAGEFSFWVYPRVDRKAGRSATDLRIKIGPHFLKTRLHVNQWQRIIIPCDKVKAPYWSDICIYGDPKEREYRKGSVSFELNGFAVYGKSDKDHGLSGLKRVRICRMTSNDGIIIMLGKPAHCAQFRYKFQKPVFIDKEKIQSSNSENTEVNYTDETQILQIATIFPDTPITNSPLEKYLSNKELSMIKTENLSPVIIKTVFK